MKHLRLFENFDTESDFQEKVQHVNYFLQDISDDDIALSVQMTEERVLILVGNEDSEFITPIPLHKYKTNFIQLNDYLTDIAGYQFKNVACWINPENDVNTYRFPITIDEFGQFISKIEEIELENENSDSRQVFLVIDMMYQKIVPSYRSLFGF